MWIWQEFSTNCSQTVSKCSLLPVACLLGVYLLAGGEKNNSLHSTLTTASSSGLKATQLCPKYDRRHYLFYEYSLSKVLLSRILFFWRKFCIKSFRMGSFVRQLYLSTHTKFTSSLFSGRMHKDTLKQY
jgi:hypothetical protein